MQPLVSGVTLLPSAGACFRTWHPARGPLRSLLKHEQGAAYYWLTGPPAALWEAVEPGITLGRLRRRAEALQMGQRLDSLLLEWHQAGWIEVRGGAPADALTRPSVAPGMPPAPQVRGPMAAPPPSLTPCDLEDVQRVLGTGSAHAGSTAGGGTPGLPASFRGVSRPLHRPGARPPSSAYSAGRTCPGLRVCRTGSVAVLGIIH